MQKPRVLFFIGGTCPTEQEQEQADSINAQVCMRNAKRVDRDSGLERCDGVAGCAPHSYVKKFGLFEGAPFAELENDPTVMSSGEAQGVADDAAEEAERAAKEAEDARKKEAKKAAAKKAREEAKAAKEAEEFAKLEAEEAAEKAEQEEKVEAS